MVCFQVINKNVCSTFQIGIAINASINSADDTVHQYIGLKGSHIGQYKGKQFRGITEWYPLLAAVMFNIVHDICTGRFYTLAIV